MTKEQSIELDFLIQKILDKNVNVRSINEIHKNVFPDKEYEYCSSLFYILNSYRPKLIDSHEAQFGYIFTPTHYASTFLYGGGFTKYFDNEFAKQQAENERQKLSDEKLSAEVDIVKFQKGLGKKLTIWGIVISVISIVASVLTTVATSHNEDKPFPIDTVSLKQQLQTLDLRLQKLEQQKQKDTIPKR
jgi:hypothetical protein